MMNCTEEFENSREAMSQLHTVALKIEIAELVDEWGAKFEALGKKENWL